MDVIAERGCDQLTFDLVAQKIGVTKGAVYWYFKTKEDLIKAVLKKFQGDFERTTFDSFYNHPIDEMLDQIFDRFSLTDHRQRAIFFEMFAMAARNSDITHSTREYYNGIIATFEEAIRKELKQHPEKTLQDTHKLALLIVALYSGLQNYQLIWMCQNEIKDLWLEGLEQLLGFPRTKKKDTKK